MGKAGVEVSTELDPRFPAADQSANPVTLTPGAVPSLGGPGAPGRRCRSQTPQQTAVSSRESVARAWPPANRQAAGQGLSDPGPQGAPETPSHSTQGALPTSATWLLQEKSKLDPRNSVLDSGIPAVTATTSSLGATPSPPLTCGGPPEGRPRARERGTWDPATHRRRETWRHLPDLLGLCVCQEQGESGVLRAPPAPRHVPRSLLRPSLPPSWLPPLQTRLLPNSGTQSLYVQGSCGHSGTQTTGTARATNTRGPAEEEPGSALLLESGSSSWPTECPESCTSGSRGSCRHLKRPQARCRGAGRCPQA